MWTGAVINQVDAVNRVRNLTEVCFEGIVSKVCFVSPPSPPISMLRAGVWNFSFQGPTETIPNIEIGGEGGLVGTFGKTSVKFRTQGSPLVNMFSSRLNYFQFRVLLKDVLLGHGGTPSQLSSIIFHNVFLIGSSFASPTNQSWPHRHPCHLLAHHAAPIAPMASFGRN